MKIVCKSCHHDFIVDEHNIDTEKIDCPKCFWPNIISHTKIAQGHFGHFAKSGTNARKFSRRSSWPKN